MTVPVRHYERIIQSSPYRPTVTASGFIEAVQNTLSVTASGFIEAVQS